MHRKSLSSPFLVLVYLVFLTSGVVAAPPPPTEPADPVKTDIELSIQKAIASQQEQLLVYMLFDTRIERISISEDKTWAIAQLVPIDPQTGYMIPAEPGLAVLHKTDGGWQPMFPDDPTWNAAIRAVPESLLSSEDKATWLAMYQQAILVSSATTFDGYKLPWEAGQKLVLTRSISHYNPPNPSGFMHYAFDFAAWHDATGHSPMFPVHAAKAGQVKFVRWTQANGDESSPGNYLVIQDLTTSPATYALYLHLAYDSIPAEMRQIGAPVSQGQYIGMADDTGNSTGNHLHFQVHTNPNSYWGNSVDITFSDVAINGGRPRTLAEASNWPQYGSQGQTEYTSGNNPSPGDQDPPYGGLYTPEQGSLQDGNQIQLSGWANDNVALASIQIKAQFDGAWHDIGPVFNSSPFSYAWNACDSQVPDGPVSLYLDIRDANGNMAQGLTGLRQFIKQYECPTTPPACQPGQNQIALFAGVDYSGACVTLGIGSHDAGALDGMGDNNAESIIVGSQVWATLFSDDQNGRSETFTHNDSSLKDNRIGADQITSLLVRGITSSPEPPALVYPDDNASFPTNSSLSLSWIDQGGGSEFQLRLDGADKPWQPEPVYHLGSIDNTPHTWSVRSRNSNGQSSWSPTRTFTLQTSMSEPTAPTITAPFMDTMENGLNGWNRGEWDQTSEENHTVGGSISFNYEIDDQPDSYETGTPNSGYLTSPSITIPTSGYFLRFWYLYETEGMGPHWDQRWVKISVDGSPYANILQLYNDPPNVWLQSPPLDLSPYAGSAIRVRFLFETLDADANDYKGWYVDDFTIDLYNLPVCDGGVEPDYSPAQARDLTYNEALSGELCPQGDEDYWKFTGQAGNLIGIAANADIPHTPDTTITLLDLDFASILAENDDRITGIITDSYLFYRLKRDGIYYIRLGAWDHPSAGGSEYDYTISIHGDDDTRPSAAITSPANNARLPLGNVNITVSAIDPFVLGETATGISHVDFQWHAGDWLSSDWINLGTDWDSLDGWSYNFDTTNLPEQSQIAVFVRVYDWAGNWQGAAIWNLWLDLTPTKTYLPLAVR